MMPRAVAEVKNRDRHYNFDERGMHRCRMAFTPFARITVPPLGARRSVTRLVITKPMIIEILVGETASLDGTPRGVTFEISHEPLTMESAMRMKGWPLCA